jgi:1-acyl-sn-glycerol-3-phosphate acyltransferase
MATSYGTRCAPGEGRGSIPRVRGELNRWWRAGLVIASPLVRLVFRVRTDGLEHVPLRGPAILAFNHLSVLDGPVLAILIGRRLSRETRFLVAAEQFRRPLIGWILRRYDQIPVRRGEGDDGALEEAIETIRRGALAGIAPEGRVNEQPTELQRIRKGVARIAIPTGAPIVPVGIWGAQERWPRGGIVWSRPWRRPRLGLTLGAPLLPAGDEPLDDALERLTSRVRERLTEQVEAARALAGSSS